MLSNRMPLVLALLGLALFPGAPLCASDEPKPFSSATRCLDLLLAKYQEDFPKLQLRLKLAQSWERTFSQDVQVRGKRTYENWLALITANAWNEASEAERPHVARMVNAHFRIVDSSQLLSGSKNWQQAKLGDLGTELLPSYTDPLSLYIEYLSVGISRRQSSAPAPDQDSAVLEPRIVAVGIRMRSIRQSDQLTREVLRMSQLVRENFEQTRRHPIFSEELRDATNSERNALLVIFGNRILMPLKDQPLDLTAPNQEPNQLLQLLTGEPNTPGSTAKINLTPRTVLELSHIAHELYDIGAIGLMGLRHLRTRMDRVEQDEYYHAAIREITRWSE